MSIDALLDPIREHVAGLGFELVDLRQVGTPARPILQLRIDRPDSGPGRGVTTADCVVVSRSLEHFLEARGAVGPRYVLEVSSPGLERPVRWPEHWRRFVGRRVRVRLPGQRRGRAREAEILAVPDDAHVSVRWADGEAATLPLGDIVEAWLVVDWDNYGKPSEGAQGRP